MPHFANSRAHHDQSGAGAETEAEAEAGSGTGPTLDRDPDRDPDRTGTAGRGRLRARAPGRRQERCRRTHQAQNPPRATARARKIAVSDHCRAQKWPAGW